MKVNYLYKNWKHLQATRKLKFDLGKVENILVSFIFSFSHNIYKRYLSQGR